MERVKILGSGYGPSDVATFDLMVAYRDQKVPCAVWLPADKICDGLVLIGHGGSQHKRSDTQEIVARLCTAVGFAAAAIDGPIHGARRSPVTTDLPSSSKEIQLEFLAMWRETHDHVERMVEDWRAILNQLLSLPEIGVVPVGYLGISMGTAYGLPLIAAEGRIAAAVLGMWGLDYPNSGKLTTAAQSIDQPVLFIARRDDEIFGQGGVSALFDAIGSEDKRMLILPGTHLQTMEQHRAGVSFLDWKLGKADSQ